MVSLITVRASDAQSGNTMSGSMTDQISTTTGATSHNLQPKDEPFAGLVSQLGSLGATMTAQHIPWSDRSQEHLTSTRAGPIPRSNELGLQILSKGNKKGPREWSNAALNSNLARWSLFPTCAAELLVGFGLPRIWPSRIPSVCSSQFDHIARLSFAAVTIHWLRAT